MHCTYVVQSQDVDISCGIIFGYFTRRRIKAIKMLRPIFFKIHAECKILRCLNVLNFVSSIKILSICIPRCAAGITLGSL